MISVLIPVYNAEYYISETLKSMANQTYKDIEILICDDFSQDNSVSIINEFVRKNKNLNIKFFRNFENKGYLKTSNFLVSQANGEYISFQDADDLADPERFLKLTKYLVENNLDLVGSYCGLIRNSKKILSIVKYSVTSDDIHNDLIRKSHPPFCGSSILVKSTVINRCGLYNIEFDRIGAEDFDWIYRVALAGFKLGNIPEPLYLYRQHVQSVTRLNFEKNKLSLFSELIAKKLYLARLNKSQHNFECLKNSFMNDENLYVDLVNYKILRNSFLGSKRELLKNISLFLFNVRGSREKTITLFSALFILAFNYEIFERFKNILKGMRS